VFGIRWLNALLGGACVVLVWRIGELLLSRRAGFFSAGAVAVGAPFLVTSRFVYTDTLTLFAMLLSVLAFWRMTRNDASTVEGLAFGVALALVLNTKYSAYAFAAALVVALFLDHYRLLHTPRLWLAAGVGALGLLPVLGWNACHNWSSLRWQLAHLTRAAIQDPGILGSAYHAWVYLTPPLIFLAAAGLGRIGSPAERLLTVLSIFLLLPVVLSPINSPRNLITGLVPLLLLAGARLPASLADGQQRAVAAGAALLLSGVALFGVGTVVNLAGPSRLPHSSIVPAIRRDAAGWEELGTLLERGSDPVFALDYSIAAQIRYYADRPAFTAWGQYRVWGIPPLHEATIVALDYLDPDVVTQGLQEAFREVEGPDRLTFTEPGVTKVVHTWSARGLRWDQETFLRRFDFLTMIQGTH
jgi:4-amino-4-deoxy-L-arabinose transferase-like glycosyltransferase